MRADSQRIQGSFFDLEPFVFSRGKCKKNKFRTARSEIYFKSQIIKSKSDSVLVQRRRRKSGIGSPAETAVLCTLNLA